MEIAEYFLERVDITDDCWLWKMATNRKGYGFFWDPRYKKLVYAHRASYEIFVDEIPEGLSVLHHCDNPPCVRPDHLFLGTAQDNSDDMVAKGRSYDRHGTRNPRARLTEDEVNVIRSIYKNKEATQSDLAKAFGVAQQTISAVVTGTNWN